MTTPSISDHHSVTPEAGPLIFQYETPQGHRYHVAGVGFAAEHFRDATRYPVIAAWPTVQLDPFIPEGGHLYALALVEVASVEETAIRASWGSKTLVLSPTNFHSEAFAIIRPLLNGLVRSGGTPFGSTLMVADISGRKERRAVFNVGFLPPAGEDDLLLPLSPFGAETPREILTRIALLGLRLRGRSEMEGFSLWQRQIGGVTLQLETGLTCRPERVRITGQEIHPVTISLADVSFTDVHPLLLAFIASSKTTPPPRTHENFVKIFTRTV